MDKYEYRVKTEQMLEYLESKQYKKAMEIADTIDWRRVKSASMLNTVSEIYEYNGEFQKSRDILFVAFDRSPGSRKIVYRLGTLALKINDVEEASDCYEEFVKLAPRDPNQYILKYRILRAQGAPLTEQIAALEDFKKAEYVEKWAYELAELYHEAGMTAECLEECDDLILWFSEGKYVYKAMELKMKYKPLTPLQQEKYDSRPGAPKKPAAKPVQAEEAVEAAEEAVEETEEPEESVADTEEPEESAADTEEEVSRPVSAVSLAQAVEEMEKSMEDSEEESEEEAVEEPEEEPAEENQEEEPEEEPQKEEEQPKKKSSITQVVKGATLEEALANGVAIASGINIEKEAMEKKEEDLRVTSQMRIDDILQEWEEKQKENAEAIAQQKAKDEERLKKEREEARRRQEAERREVERKAAEAEAARKAAEAEAARKAAEEEAARKAAEEEAARKAAEEEAARKAAEEAEKEALLDNAFAEGKTQRIPDDLVRLVAEMDQDEKEEESLESEDTYEDFEDFEFEEEPEQLSLEDIDFGEEFEDEEPEDTDYEEDFEEELEDADYEEDFEEEDFEDADFEEDFEDADFEDDFDDDYEDDFEDADFDEEDFEEEDFDEDDFEEEDFEEEDFDEEDFEEEDFEEEDFEEENLEEEDFEEDEEEFEAEELEIEEPSEEEIQERIKKSKGSGVPFDTGFVVTGRYDLSATSEIGLKAGLTEEQKKLFSYFVPVRGMSEQIVEVLDNDRRAQREGTSKTGNLLVVGRKGSGKTVLAVDIVKAIQKQRNLKQGKVAIVTGESLNKKELTNIIQKLKGGAIIIEKAGKLNSRTIKELNYLMEKKTGELLFVLEDQRKPLERMLAVNADFKKKFTSKLELPVFINDELVTFGQTYAKENGYKLDEMGILALYSRIDVMQREDHAVSVAEVKEIMDEAIDHSQKANVKHLARRVFGKGTDDSDRIILKEEDFKI